MRGTRKRRKIFLGVFTCGWYTCGQTTRQMSRSLRRSFWYHVYEWRWRWNRYRFTICWTLGPEIGSVLGGHGGQPTDTSSSMLHGDADTQASQAQLAISPNCYARRWEYGLQSQAKAHFDLTHNDKYDHGGANMADKSGDVFGGSFTPHCPIMCASNSEASRQ